MKRLMLLAAGLLAFSGVASAEDNYMAGYGMSSCGKYVSARKENPKGMATLAYASWAQGFMTGINMVSVMAKQPHRNLPDMDSMMIYLDNYCQANPLKEFNIAVAKLYFDELEMRPSSK